MSLQELIRFIVWYATQADIRLTKNRLVKFIYLADVIHARLNSGKKLSNLPWQFVNYGPYCREALIEIEAACKTGLIACKTYESYFGSDKEYIIYECQSEEAESWRHRMHPALVGNLELLLKRLGDDTPALLDYVYFETEPMEKPIKKLDYLDFSRCRYPHHNAPIAIKKISGKRILEGRGYIESLVAKMREGKKQLIVDEVATKDYKDDKYYNLLDSMDEQELPTGLSGIAVIEN